MRTYQGYFDKVEHELTDEQIDKFATITPYATGATIKDLVNGALIIASWRSTRRPPERTAATPVKLSMPVGGHLLPAGQEPGAGNAAATP